MVTKLCITLYQYWTKFLPLPHQIQISLLCITPITCLVSLGWSGFFHFLLFGAAFSGSSTQMAWGVSENDGVSSRSLCLSSNFLTAELKVVLLTICNSCAKRRPKRHFSIEYDRTPHHIVLWYLSTFSQPLQTFSMFRLMGFFVSQCTSFRKWDKIYYNLCLISPFQPNLTRLRRIFCRGR